MSLPTPITRKEVLLNAAATGQTEGLPVPITREETYLKAIAENGGGGGGGGTTNYNALSNKPQINGVTLSGNKTAEQLGIGGTMNYNELSNRPQINGRTLTGDLDTDDLGIRNGYRATYNGSSEELTFSM